MDELIIRRATREDVAEIVRLLADDELGRTRERYEKPLPGLYYDAFDEIDRDPNNELVVGEVDGEVVATLQLTVIPYLARTGSRRALVEAVRVDSRVRGRRLGERLIEWAIGRARERGCTILQLTTDKRRADAHRFYARLGFEASHEGMKRAL
jgi:GNAT superfamily N-acetyltransferase